MLKPARSTADTVAVATASPAAVGFAPTPGVLSSSSSPYSQLVGLPLISFPFTSPVVKLANLYTWYVLPVFVGKVSVSFVFGAGLMRAVTVGIEDVGDAATPISPTSGVSDQPYGAAGNPMPHGALLFHDSVQPLGNFPTSNDYGPGTAHLRGELYLPARRCVLWFQREPADQPLLTDALVSGGIYGIEA